MPLHWGILIGYKLDHFRWNRTIAYFPNSSIFPDLVRVFCRESRAGIITIDRCRFCFLVLCVTTCAVRDHVGCIDTASDSLDTGFVFPLVVGRSQTRF